MPSFTPPNNGKWTRWLIGLGLAAIPVLVTVFMYQIDREIERKIAEHKFEPGHQGAMTFVRDFETQMKSEQEMRRLLEVRINRLEEHVIKLEQTCKREK